MDDASSCFILSYKEFKSYSITHQGGCFRYPTDFKIFLKNREQKAEVVDEMFQLKNIPFFFFDKPTFQMSVFSCIILT